MDEKEKIFWTDGKRKFLTNICERVFEIIFSVGFIGLLVYIRLHPEIKLKWTDIVVSVVTLLIVLIIGILVAPKEL